MSYPYHHQDLHADVHCQHCPDVDEVDDADADAVDNADADDAEDDDDAEYQNDDDGERGW